MTDSTEMARLQAIDNADGHQTLIRLQWANLAAFAWQHYLSQGRGAVVVDFQQALKDASSSQLPTYYIAEGSELLEKQGGWPNEEIADVIGQYEPEEDVVIVFARINGEYFYYNVSDDLTPREAYQKWKESST
jgi:hypothetical protein